MNELERVAQLIEEKAQALNCSQLSKEIAAGIIVSRLIAAEIETTEREKKLDSWSIERIMADRHKRLP